MKMHRLGTLLGLIATVGCGSEQNLPPGAATADSAGIRIVASTGAPPQFHPVSVTTIGALAGEEMYTFNRINDVEIHPSGVLYVLDGGDNMVKVYDLSGRHVYSFGREGEGPAEFLAASNLIMWSDTVAVFDWRLQRISRFDAHNGDYLIAERMPYSLSYAGWPAAVERLPSGEYLIVGTSGCQLPKISENSIWRVFLAQSELGITDTIANRLRGNNLPFYGEQDSFCGAASYPFGASPILAADQGRMAIATGERGEIWVYDRSRDLQSPDEIWRYEVPPTAVTEQDRIAYAGQFAEAKPEYRGAFRKALEERGFPSEWPRVADLLFDDDGRLWAARGGPEDSEHRIWDVLSAEGEHIAVVRFPAGIHLRDVSAEHAVGVRRDEMKVEHVELYQILDLDGVSP